MSKENTSILQWSLFDGGDVDINHQLEYAKTHSFKVPLDFEIRFRVWKDQVLVDRLQQLEKNKTLEFAIRYVDLTLRDVVRLHKRATKEFLEVANIPNIAQMHLKFFQSLYDQRKELLAVQNQLFIDKVVNIELRG